MESAKSFILLLTLLGLALAGCEVMPVTRYKPTLHNPFVGEMYSVAVIPFYNLTDNPRVDGREFARLFALELQRVRGFKVVANKIVEETMWEHEADLHRLETVDDIRYLAQLLKVDAIVIGKIHEFSMIYPPFTKFETEWYSVNPYLHPIPAGRGLPWGTEYEHFIPEKIVMQAEMEFARAQIQTQTPKFEPVKPAQTGNSENARSDFELVPPRIAQRNGGIVQMAATIPNNMNVQSTDEMSLLDLAQRKQDLEMDRLMATTGIPFVPEADPVTEREQKELYMRTHVEHPLRHGPWKSETAQANQLPLSQQNQHPTFQQNMGNLGDFLGHYPGFPTPEGETVEQLTEYGWVAQPITPVPPQYPLMPGMPVEGHYGMVMGDPDRFPGLPHDWPDPRGFIPDGPQPERAVGTVKNNGPIISWINVYKGDDTEFMQALDDYNFLFRDDKRLDGKQTILANRNEFITFCCRMHIWEIFAARGGISPAERVTRAWKPQYVSARPY